MASELQDTGSTYHRARRRVYEILSAPGDGDPVAAAVNVGLITLILLNVAAVVLETVRSVEIRWGGFFHAFEVFSVAVFSVEYILRIWSCTLDARYRSPVTGRIRFALRPLLFVDLLAVAPFYFAGLVRLDLRSLRMLRLLRLARALKIARYSEALQTLGQVFVAKRGELLTTLFAVSILLVMASTLMYYAEQDAQPEAFSSIPATMWWAVETLTTVGYGDMCPATPLGKLMSAVIAVLGIGFFAIPAGLLGSGFVEQLQEKRKAARTCPHCGRSLDR